MSRICLFEDKSQINDLNSYSNNACLKSDFQLNTYDLIHKNNWLQKHTEFSRSNSENSAIFATYVSMCVY